MKLIYKLLLLMTISTFIEASYHNVQFFYKQKNYTQVLKEAKKSFSDYGNVNLHILWARSAKKLGKNIEAMAGYERVLMFDENNREAKNALKEIYKATQRDTLSNTVSQTQEVNFIINTNMAFGYDTNIDINPGSNALDEYYDISSNVEPISTAFVRFNGNFMGKYHFKSNNNYFMRGSFNLYNQTNFSATKYNLTKLSLESGLGYGDDTYQFYIPMGYHKLLFFSKNLLSDYVVSPDVKFTVFQDSVVNIGASYTKRNFVDTIDQGRDSSLISGHLGAYFSLVNVPLHLDVAYEKRTASNSIKERYVDSDLLSFDASVNYFFTNEILLNIHNVLRYATYKDDIGTAQISADILRRDYINQTDLKVSYAFNKVLELYLQETYTKSYSNYIPAEYSKNIFLLGMNYKF